MSRRQRCNGACSTGYGRSWHGQQKPLRQRAERKPAPESAEAYNPFWLLRASASKMLRSRSSTSRACSSFSFRSARSASSSSARRPRAPELFRKGATSARASVAGAAARSGRSESIARRPWRTPGSAQQRIARGDERVRRFDTFIINLVSARRLTATTCWTVAECRAPKCACDLDSSKAEVLSARPKARTQVQLICMVYFIRFVINAVQPQRFKLVCTCRAYLPGSGSTFGHHMHDWYTSTAMFTMHGSRSA